MIASCVQTPGTSSRLQLAHAVHTAAIDTVVATLKQASYSIASRKAGELQTLGGRELVLRDVTRQQSRRTGQRRSRARSRPSTLVSVMSIACSA